ncbi:dienelactone hydrolase family protein [Cohnella sp.]|uniref:dienelactone hydrolase family protein n=1 Tax=Cohnella sp. TaxID=1883426 RepID=UPI0035676A59
MWNGDALIDKLYEQAREHRERIGRDEAPGQKKSRLKDSLKASLGEFELTADTYNPDLLERVECDGYIRERVELSVVSGLTFGAYILIPANAAGKLPGVIAVHGHGYGSRQICGMRPDGTTDTGEPDIYNHFAVQLVKKGFVVIAPDVIGFGERRMQADLAVDPDTPSSCYTMSTHLLMLGKTLTGLRVAEMLGTLDYFAQRPEVDSTRIGIAGFSGGSLIAYVASALDERIRASLLIGFPNTFKDSIMAVHHCVCNYSPGILMQAELPELMGLIAPRPLFLESGDNDPIFPAVGFSKAVQQLQQIYKQEGVDHLLKYDLFPGVHEISGRISFEWLKSVLA